MQRHRDFCWRLGGLDFCNVARHNVFYKVHLHSMYVLIKVANDLLYHSVLFLDEFFVSDKYFSKEYFLGKHLIHQQVHPVSPTTPVCSHYPTQVASTVTF